MNITNVSQGITRLTSNIENMLFEGFWEIPNGVSINSYVVKGEKTALIDGVLAFKDLKDEHIDGLKRAGIAIKDIDYIIINHMEPDHSSWIESIHQFNEKATIVCGQKSALLLDAFFGKTDNIKIVKDGDTLDLGDGRVLAFKEIPNVHWPDTIATFDTKSGTLFSCDAFGSYGKVYDNGYDDLLSDDEIAYYESEALRYYANIVAAFSLAVTNALKKCADLDIKVVAPGHGIVWRKNPSKIIKDYARYASYQKGPCEKEITLLIGSMYGMTRKGAEAAIDAFSGEDVKLHIHDVVEDSWSIILASVWQSSGVILAMPTYEYKMYPPMASVLEEICKKKAMNRKAFRLGSYGWSGGAQKELDEIMTKNRSNWEFLEPVEYMGAPTDEDIKNIRSQVKALIALVKED
jgi:anaerobic nitric oxide reductase flavorubredoxin